MMRNGKFSLIFPDTWCNFTSLYLHCSVCAILIQIAVTDSNKYTSCLVHWISIAWFSLVWWVKESPRNISSKRWSNSQLETIPSSWRNSSLNNSFETSRRRHDLQTYTLNDDSTGWQEAIRGSSGDFVLSKVLWWIEVTKGSCGNRLCCHFYLHLSLEILHWGRHSLYRVASPLLLDFQHQPRTPTQA